MRKYISIFTFILLAFTYACGTGGSDGFVGPDDDGTVQFDPMNPGDPVDPNDPNNNGPEVAEENPCQGMPGGCIDIAKVDPGIFQIGQNKEELNAAHKAYVQLLKDSGAYPDANLEEVAQQWQDTVGTTPIKSLHLNRANLTKFLQFVRVSRDPFIDILLDMAGKNNRSAVVFVEYYIDPAKVDNLEHIRDSVELQKLQLAPIKTAILKTAKIYGVQITDVGNDFDKLAGPFASEVTDTIAGHIDAHKNASVTTKSKMIGINLGIFVELHGLLHEASFKIADKDEYVSFVDFLLHGPDAFAPGGEYLHRERLYGAHPTADLSFIK